MIQRKQTLFLLLSLLASGALFFYTNKTEFIGMTFNALAALLALITIFLYKKRTLQVKLSYVLMLLQLAITLLVSFTSISSNSELASIIGIVGAMGAYFAVRYIKKDIALLKSADRIR
ncbi:MAG: DUF4293 family protein [Bacteroidetes bacterium]|nr:DUF4293 family protein [Bacteroidota bacterium]